MPFGRCVLTAQTTRRRAIAAATPAATRLTIRLQPNEDGVLYLVAASPQKGLAPATTGSRAMTGTVVHGSLLEPLLRQLALYRPPGSRRVLQVRVDEAALPPQPDRLAHEPPHGEPADVHVLADPVPRHRGHPVGQKDDPAVK